MYSPQHYREENAELIKDIFTHYGFSTLITIHDGKPKISHVPLKLQSEKPYRLIGHIARANDHWRDFEADKNVTAVFNGPHAYVSPDWYVEDPSNVPTWNYVAIHCQCRPRIVRDPAECLDLMNQLVRFNEKQNGTAWEFKLPAGADHLQLMKAIVIFELEVLELDAKFKLSQNQEPPNRLRVIREFEARPESRDLAAFMKKTQR